MVSVQEKIKHQLVPRFREGKAWVRVDDVLAVLAEHETAQKQKLLKIEESWHRAYPLDTYFDHNVQKILTKLFYELREELAW